MRRRLALWVAAAALAAAALAALAGPPERDTAAFHARLAGPGTYPGGTHEGSFHAEAGEYRLRFVPSGSSPEVLTVALSGPSVAFSEDFELVGTRAETAEYYTWRYDGGRAVEVPEAQEISITIDPNGDVMGSVSVYVEAVGE